MPYCLNPKCDQPVNLADNSQKSEPLKLELKFCKNCGAKLQLKGLYEAIALIGQGGMGRTFRGIDWGRLGQPCAIKQFLPQVREPRLLDKAIALFEREARQLQDLGSHPQIPELIAYFEAEGCLYLVQELIEGDNLYNELQKHGAFDGAKISQLLLEILPVLQFVHDRQVIHRDIKPDNIIRRISPNNLEISQNSLVLVDFGAAKSIKANKANRTGTLIGSAEYIAPEQARGKAVTQSDLYSLGVTCIHLLTGISPFDLYDDISDRWIWREKLVHAIPSDLAKIIDRLLAKAISDRYSSANQVLEDLRSPLLTSPLSSESEIKASNSLHIPSELMRQLREALELGAWQEGDRLTNQIILEIAHKSQIKKLNAKDIQQIPCEVWLAIDQAWSEFSNQRFGWSSQLQIWRSLGGRLIYSADNYWEFAAIYQKFGDRLGWRRSRWIKWWSLPLLPKVWRKYESLDFSIAAPVGHLPTLFYWEGCNLVDPVLYRLQTCRDR